MPADPSTAVSYVVRVLPAQHALMIEITLEGSADPAPLRFEVPTWVPGDYNFRQIARDVFDLKAQCVKTGEELKVKREGWQAFLVPNWPGPIRLSYRAYAYGADFSEACGVVDTDFALLLGSRYLHVGNIERPCRVTYELPAGWKIHHPSGAARRGDSLTWDYPSYEVLVDTPVVMGEFDLQRRKVEGTDFVFVFVDRAPGFKTELEGFLDGVSKAVSQVHKVFGSFPFDDYTFFFSFNPDYDWGLEHLTSTTCGLSVDALIDPAQMATAIRVCVHELFHAWNVRRLRPAPLKKLDLYNGSYTEGLWLAEGFTRYYEFLVCTRSRAYSAEQWLSAIVNYYRHLVELPAYERVSAVDSSLTTFLNHGKYPGRCNNSIDYYNKGMLIAFDVDATLRLNAAPKSLDGALRLLYEKFVKSALGYTTAEVAEFFNDVQTGLGDQLLKEVAGRGGLTVESHLERLGFKVDEESVLYLGLLFDSSSGPKIFDVFDESPAGTAGLAPNDVIQRVNDYPFSLKILQWHARRKESVRLDVIRGNRTLQVKLDPVQRTRIRALLWVGSDEQAIRIQGWLQSDFRPSSSAEINLDFYEDFHGVTSLV